MEKTPIQQFCRSIQAPATVKRYRDFGLGVLLILLNQFMVVPIQVVLDQHQIGLPASILVMVFVFLVMIIANQFHDGVALFYNTHLQGPTSFLGRHMSLGFVAPFVMLSRDHITDALDAPRIAASFVVLTLISYLVSFLVAFGSFKLEKRYRGSARILCDPGHDIDNEPWPRLRQRWPAPSTQTGPKRISKLSKLNGLFMYNDSFTSVETPPSISTYQPVESFIQTLPIWIFSLLLLTVGLPVYIFAGIDTPFETIYFILVWVCCLQLLKSLKSSHSLLQLPKVRSTLIILANPVLLTAGFGTAYFWIKTLIVKTTIDHVITEFRKHSTLAEVFVCLARGCDSGGSVGAGDLACLILDAGILCLGLKMFQYRRELAASFYSVMSTCLVSAATGVFLNVALARKTGLGPQESLAFAAKSVTIALGVPAVERVDGSTALMSALCIFSGMLFQMFGDSLFNVLRIDDRRRAPRRPSEDNGSGSETEKPVSFDWFGECSGTSSSSNNDIAGEDMKLLAAGVTVGINAAAMGTAHLMERDSTAIAYSALSMTIFGGITVGLTALPGVSNLLVYLASK